MEGRGLRAQPQGIQPLSTARNPRLLSLCHPEPLGAHRQQATVGGAGPQPECLGRGAKCLGGSPTLGAYHSGRGGRKRRVRTPLPLLWAFCGPSRVGAGGHVRQQRTRGHACSHHRLGVAMTPGTALTELGTSGSEMKGPRKTGGSRDTACSTSSRTPVRPSGP